MARTLKEIQNSIKTEFVQNPTLRQAYGLDTDKEFDQQFSKVSVEALLIYVVATVIWAHENLWDRFAQEIEEKVNSSQVMTIPWYYHMALNFQYKDELKFNQERYAYEYQTPHEANKIIKYAAIREVIDTEKNITLLKIFVSKDVQGIKTPLLNDEKIAFEKYIKDISAAGTHYEVISKEPERIGFNIDIVYDPLVLRTIENNQRPQSLENENVYPVEEAISNYLNEIEYGGEFYATKLVDALQKTKGITDVELKTVNLKNEDTETGKYRRKVESPSGAFTVDFSNSLISFLTEVYVGKIENESNS